MVRSSWARPGDVTGGRCPTRGGAARARGRRVWTRPLCPPPPPWGAGGRGAAWGGAGGAMPTTSALDVVDGEVRELIRRRGLDPFTDPGPVRVLARDVVRDHSPPPPP